MKITVIGAAGCIGASAAFYIAARGLADEMVMIGGKQQNVLKHHAMDIDTAVAADDVTVRAGSFEDMAGSGIVINAAGIHQDLSSTGLTERLPLNLPVIKDIALNINRFCPDAVVITATNPIDPLNYAMYLLSSHRDRSKFIGYSRNDSTRFQMLVARALGVKTSQTEATVIGEHARTMVPLFSSIRVAGKPVPVTADFKQKVRQQHSAILYSYEELKAGRTAGWTTAAGLAATCQAIVHNTPEMIPCSVVLYGEYGCRSLSMGVPAIVDREGVLEVLDWQLPPDEQTALELSINTLKPAMRYVEENLGTS